MTQPAASSSSPGLCLDVWGGQEVVVLGGRHMATVLGPAGYMMIGMNSIDQDGQDRCTHLGSAQIMDLWPLRFYVCFYVVMFIQLLCEINQCASWSDLLLWIHAFLCLLSGNICIHLHIYISPCILYGHDCLDARTHLFLFHMHVGYCTHMYAEYPCEFAHTHTRTHICI